MPTPLAAFVGAAVIAASGVGVSSLMLGSGGTSKASAARTPLLTPDPTGRPAHSKYRYSPNSGVQSRLPGTPAAGGEAPNVGPGPDGGAAYVPHGKLLAPLPPIGGPAATPRAQSWPLYLSGSDLLQPDSGGAVTTDQSVGPSLADACSNLGQAGRWTAPPPGPISFHGSAPGLLRVISGGPVTLTISLTVSTYGGSCSTLSSTTASAGGSGAVPFTLPRFDANLPAGVNVSLVVAASTSARIESHSGSFSYLIAPSPPQ